MRAWVAVLMAAGMSLAGSPARAAEQPVSLIVGTRGGTVELDDVPVLKTERLTGASVVDVPASDVAEATEALRDDPDVTYVEPDHVAYAAAVAPNDPGFGAQWAITRTRVAQAWDTTRGSGRITVAVVDTGVTALPDLAPRLLAGYDFVNDDGNATDDNGHGTMAAGVIGATANNGVGIAGICPLCRILPVKVLGAGGSGSYSDIAEGIRYAADRGADVINLSLGGPSDSRLLRDAVAYAAGRGALVLAAAGNENSSAPHYPAAIPSVVAVGGSTAGETRYEWSNHGAGWVDLAAPGCNPAQTAGGRLAQFCGTSSATPFAAGVAALLASTTPQPSAAVIRAALTASAVPLAGGWVAAGRIDAPAALAALPAVTADRAAPTTSFRFPVTSAVVHGVVAVGARAADDTGIRKVELSAGTRLVGTDTTSPYAFRWSSAGRTGTVHLTLRAYDRAGNVATSRLTVRADNAGPAVTVTSAPASGARVARTAYLTAKATDPAGVGRLELVVNGRTIARYAGSAHRFTVPAATAGKIVRVQVRGYDRLGNARLTPVRTWRR
jgi:thermitase